MNHKTPFPSSQLNDAVARSLQELIRTLHREDVHKVISPGNVQRLHHGTTWRTHSGDEAAKQPSEMQAHSLDHSVGFADVVQHRLALIPEMILQIRNGMLSQLMGTLYAMVQESTDSSGNVVNASAAGSPQAAFLQLLEKIEFGVDGDGQPTYPQIHVHPSNTMLDDLKAAGPEFEAQVNAITKSKIKDALAREAERLSKFKG